MVSKTLRHVARISRRASAPVRVTAWLSRYVVAQIHVCRDHCRTLVWLTLVLGCALLCDGKIAMAQQQRSIDELIEMLGSDDRDRRRDAAHELVDFGPEAVGALPGLIAALEDRDTQIWHDATQALAHLGPKAAPALEALIGTMDSRDDQRRFRTAHAIGSIGVVALPAMRTRLNADREEVREVAVRAIGQMGPAAHDAVPDLVQRLADDAAPIRLCAINSLAEIGPPAFAAVHQALDNPDPVIRMGAAKTLAAMGPSAHESLSTLIALSKEDREVGVRAASVAALGRVGPDRTEILAPLILALQDESDAVKRASVESWISVTPAIQIQATESLIELIGADDASLRTGVLLILNRFGVRAAAATPALLEQLTQDLNSTELTTTLGQIGENALEPTYAALRDRRITPTEVARIIQGMPSKVKRGIARKIDDQSPIVRQLAATTLGDLVPFPRDGIEILSRGIRDESLDVRRAAAQSARRIGDKAGPLSEDLLEAIRSEQVAAVRAEMIHALASIVPQATGEDRLLGCLEVNLQHNDNRVRIAALEELAQLQELPKTVIDPLRDLLENDDPRIRGLSAEAISRMKSGRRAAAKLLLARLDDDDLAVRQSTMRSLARMGDAAAPAVEKIQSQLKSESPETQVAAIEALSQLGKHANSALPQLAILSTTGSEPVRKAALKGIRKVAAQPSEAVPILIRGLEDSEWTIRRAVALELGELEESAAPAVPTLLKMMQNEEESDAARAALRDIGTAEEDALPTLLEILQDRRSGRRTRYYALFIMRKMGSKAKPALPVLKELRDKSDGSLNDDFDRAIKAIETDA